MAPWLSFQMLYCSSERSTWSTLNLQERSWKVNWLPNTPQKQCMLLSLNKSVPSVPTYATKIQSSTQKKHSPKTWWIITKHPRYPRVQGGLLHGYPTKNKHLDTANQPIIQDTQVLVLVGHWIHVSIRIRNWDLDASAGNCMLRNGIDSSCSFVNMFGVERWERKTKQVLKEQKGHITQFCLSQFNSYHQNVDFVVCVWCASDPKNKHERMKPWKAILLRPMGYEIYIPWNTVWCHKRSLQSAPPSHWLPRPILFVICETKPLNPGLGKPSHMGKRRTWATVGPEAAWEEEGHGMDDSSG